MAAGKKIEWTNEMLNFVKTSFGKLTCREMAIQLNISSGAVREKYRKLGLKAMEMEYWTDEQILYLKENFTQFGDVELAMFFEKEWPKNKPWTKKHIEKKRNYLHLHRSKKELSQIRWGNYHKGLMHAPSRFAETEYAEDGEIRMWRQDSGRLIPKIKINGNFEDWGKYMWRNHYGEVPPGYNVVFKGDPSILKLENLELKTNFQLAEDMFSKARNLTDEYVLGMICRGKPKIKQIVQDHFPELIELKKEQLKLQRELKNENI